MNLADLLEHLHEGHGWSTTLTAETSPGNLRKLHRKKHPECWHDQGDSLHKRLAVFWPGLTLREVMERQSQISNGSCGSDDDLTAAVKAWMEPDVNQSARKHWSFGLGCLYCKLLGHQTLPGPLTKEHIPPQCIYLSPPSNAIYVPACKHHNSEQSEDDDHFALALFTWVFQSFPASHWVKEVQRRVKRGTRFIHPVLSKLKQEEIISSGGVITGLAPKLELNRIRIHQSLSKIAMGLHWRHTRRPLQFGTEFGISTELSFEQSLHLSAYSSVVAPIGQNNGFSYRYVLSEDGSSGWLLTFYNEVTMWVGAFPPGSSAPGGKAAGPSDVIPVSPVGQSGPRTVIANF